jgi:mRNA-degrading endonuclease RelE of RelBE toxin-antitoxin system
VENFEVQLSTRAEKHLRRLDSKTREAISEALLEMEIDPFGGDHKKLSGGEGHRRRIRDYRILYDVDTDLRLVRVYGVLHRREAYR